MPQTLYEKYRLSRLRRLGVLDTPPEARFDNITAIAKEVYETDIALVSLLDADRQWFKSNQGLAVNETDRSLAFCDKAIRQNEVFIVNDASKDPRFLDNPLVTGDPSIRFYAGMPIREPTGFKVGTLCIIDSKPRTMQSSDLETLRALASLIECEFAQIYKADEQVTLVNKAGLNTCCNYLQEAVQGNQQNVDYGVLLNRILSLTSCQYGIISFLPPGSVTSMEILAIHRTEAFTAYPKFAESLEAVAPVCRAQELSEELTALMAEADQYFNTPKQSGSLSMSLPIKNADDVLGFIILCDDTSGLSPQIAEELDTLCQLLGILFRQKSKERARDVKRATGRAL